MLIKKIIIHTIILFCVSTTAISQTVVDMAGNSQNSHYQNGAFYIKDVNNYFGRFLGTWNYVDGNKEFRITITKETKFHDTDPSYGINYYIDGLKIKYRKYENGLLVYASPNDDYPTGISKAFGEVALSFKDGQRNGEVFPLSLKLIPVTGLVPDELRYKLHFKLDMFERRNTYHDQHPDEPYFSVPDNIILTKMTGLILED